MMGLEVSSRNAACCWKIARLACHTALFTLKPEPNASCHTLSPLLRPRLVSIYASTYLRRGSGPTQGSSPQANQSCAFSEMLHSAAHTYAATSGAQASPVNVVS